MADLDRSEKLEVLASDLEHENRLLKDELIMAEKAIEKSTLQLEKTSQVLKEVQRFLNSVKSGPRDSVSRTIQAINFTEIEVDNLLTNWVLARKMRQESSNEDK